MATTIELSPVELQGLCERYLSQSAAKDSTQLEILNCKWKPISEAPTGFLGSHLFLTIEVKQRQSQHPEKLYFFTKSAPIQNKSRMDYLEEFGVFAKEIIVCRDVLPQLQTIVPEFSPKCYYAHNNLLIFENLDKSQFQLAAARDGLLDYEHLACALKSLAAMHAATFVYEKRAGKSFAALFPQAVQENAYPLAMSAEHVRRQNFDNGVRVLQALIKEMPKYAAQMTRIIAEIPKKMEAIFALAQVSAKHRNTFCHGDLWANNLMFRYGKFGHIPIECRLIDFQLARYAPPILDVITVLTIPTTRQFREHHLDELLSDYYRFMGEFLKREQLNIADFLGEREFFASLKEFRICGLIESFLFSHLTMLPLEVTQSLTGSEEGFSDFFNRKRVCLCVEAFRADRVYRERLTDMIEDLVDRFILNAE